MWSLKSDPCPLPPEDLSLPGRLELEVCLSATLRSATLRSGPMRMEAAGNPPPEPRVVAVKAPRSDSSQLPEGEYLYWVAAGSKHGRSAMVEAGVAAVLEGHEARLAIETSGASYIEVYRSAAYGAVPVHVFRVKAEPQMTFVDRGCPCPNCPAWR